jgi:pimeloyl-ACP methyl ester carboxylesterase
MGIKRFPFHRMADQFLHTDANGEPGFLDVAGAAIAVRHRDGASPGLVWLGGYRSDMRGAKAGFLDGYAQERGLAFSRHDYSGHGKSGGAFAEGTVSRWVAESLAVLAAFTQGPQVLIGSSMGAWIALRMLRELANEKGRVAGLVLLAPAPDFTSDLVEPALSGEQRRELDAKGFMSEPSAYGSDPDIFTKALLEDGRRNRVLTGRIDTHCPVHVIHGLADAVVPTEHVMKLVSQLPADDVTVSLVPGGDHRLSRPEDLALLARALDTMIADREA